jgi:serine/threonine protein kinase/predicted negative regulator of RcsB-dependent stress response
MKRQPTYCRSILRGLDAFATSKEALLLGVASRHDVVGPVALELLLSRHALPFPSARSNTIDVGTGRQMREMKNFFANLFVRNRRLGSKEGGAILAGRSPGPEARRQRPSADAAPTFKKGDLIGGEYEICNLLGVGGFGEVYMVYDRVTESFCAFKTIRADKFTDDTFYEAFKREALLWVKLEQHPFVLGARSVQNYSGRLFVVMDYVAPDARGRISLLDHLAQARAPLNMDLALTWAIQFCYGMEHAYRRGIKCHRDIKPANILITRDGTLKITDFGLAVAADAAWKDKRGSSVNGKEGGSFGLSLIQAEGRRICGTPGYVAPELFLGKGANPRSDVYSFGLVLWQMATGSPVPPFHVPNEGDIEKYLRRVYQQQIKGRVPAVGEPLQSIVERCLTPEPSTRYGTFEELRRNLEPIFHRRTGQVVKLPRNEDLNKYSWTEKGHALLSLGNPQEALACFDKVLEIDPRCAACWINKANALNVLDRRREAIDCCNKALEMNPEYASAWSLKGDALFSLGWREKVMACSKALDSDPRDAADWNNKGNAQVAMGKPQKALACFDKALEIDPRCAACWSGKGNALDELDRHEEAMLCWDMALEIDPRHALAWNNKGNALVALGRSEEGKACYGKAAEIELRRSLALNNRSSALLALGLSQEAVGGKITGNALLALILFQEAVASHDKAHELDPDDIFALRSKGHVLEALGWLEEAFACYDRAIQIDPRYARGWIDKGDALRSRGRADEALACYDKALAINPRDAQAWRSKGMALLDLRRWEEWAACWAKEEALGGI